MNKKTVDHNFCEVDSVPKYSNPLAMKCVYDGNTLLKQRNVSEAIKKYDEAIKECPYYAIPHYNKRIALSMQNDIPSMSTGHTEMDTNLISARLEDLHLGSQADACFVVNIIAAVPDDSEATNEELNYEFCFTTRPKNRSSNVKTEVEMIEENRDSYKNQGTADSTVVDPLLFNLLLNGFEKKKKNMFSKIAVSIGLNRMYSLSKRKNKSLILELNSRVSTIGIKYKVFAFYWKPVWYDKYGKEVSIQDVRKYYKELKIKDINLAKKFLSLEEKVGNNIPYQQIREYAKNHPKTKELIKEFRNNNPTSLIYLHLVDADVYDFNGVYSAYLRVIRNCYIPPTVMSTGYEYPMYEEPELKITSNSCVKKPHEIMSALSKNLSTKRHAYYLSSHSERMIRVTTAFHIPLGTYYPEPNLCILIPQDCETVKESFIDRTRGNGRTHESPILLKNININRENVYCIFSEDKPIITSIPSRAKVDKEKEIIQFSKVFDQGPAGPNSNDIKKFAQISQSHTNHSTWINSLFINRSMKYNNESDEKCIHDPLPKALYEQCKGLISAIKKNIKSKIDVESSQCELANCIGTQNANCIVNAIKITEQFNDYFETIYERTPEEDELFNIMHDLEIPYSEISRRYALMIVTSTIMELIKNSEIELEKLIELDEETLEVILNRDIVEALRSRQVDFDDLIDNMDLFSAALFDGYDVQDVLELYKKNPLHLRFITGDPCDIVCTEVDDYEILEFAMENQYIDDEDKYEIETRLLDGREDSANHMQFLYSLIQLEDKREKEQYDYEEEIREEAHGTFSHSPGPSYLTYLDESSGGAIYMPSQDEAANTYYPLNTPLDEGSEHEMEIESRIFDMDQDE